MGFLRQYEILYKKARTDLKVAKNINDKKRATSLQRDYKECVSTRERFNLVEA